MGLPAFFFGLVIPIIAGIGLGFALYGMSRPIEAPQRTSSGKRKGSFYYELPKEATDCPICLGEIKPGEGYILNCGHEYHSRCRDEMYKNKVNHCPICRRPIIY